ncbi:MAG: pseudouridine synthase [Woeseia sp.]|nr:pseudouridine synthase [Woeseia sp.]
MTYDLQHCFLRNSRWQFKEREFTDNCSALRGRRYTAPVPLVLLNKPFRVLSQFSDAKDRATLADFIDVPEVYPAGRLDLDSEGLLLLTDDGRLQARIAEPRQKLPKRYWVQVEGTPEAPALARLERGVHLKDGAARALLAKTIDAPEPLWPRDPPIRERKNIPTHWLELVIDEGRNRQIRRMTAAVGLPTLRLIRHRIGPWSVAGLKPGESRAMPSNEAWAALQA